MPLAMAMLWAASHTLYMSRTRQLLWWLATVACALAVQVCVTS